MAKSNYDFSGWATKYNVRCSDGRTIRPGSFAHQDGEKVPLVWNHGHNDPDNILGYAILHSQDDGVKVDCSFNDSPKAQRAKNAVKHGDIDQLSIWARKLKQHGSDVVHGAIREVSLVISGANPGAFIDTASMAHSDLFDGFEEEDAGIIYTGEYIELHHSDDDDDEKKKRPPEDEDDNEEAEEEKAESKESKESEGESEDDDKPKKKKKEDDDVEHGEGKTVGEVFDTLTDEQKDAVYVMLAQAAEMGGEDEAEHSEENFEMEENEMKHNIFDLSTTDENDVELSHAEQMDIIKEAKENHTLLSKAWEGFQLAHAEDYGIKDIEWLFPEYKNLNTPPEFIKREMDWVPIVLNGVHKTPFSRIKSMQADITEDEARAKGYIKGNRKTEEVFSLLRRTTDPQTIYKKQKLDRDDIIDITDFDVVAWIKAEMRMMLDEEIARAILIGDGRSASSPDKIQQNHVRAISLDTDEDLYAVKVPIVIPAKKSNESDDDFADRKSKKLIREIKKAKKLYKGSGNPAFFTTEDYVTDMLLLEDGIGHPLYETEDKLRTALRVSAIHTVPVMEGYTVDVENETTHTVETYNLVGIIVNLKDYNVGADKGGAVSMFEDFDIDFNQEKYLIETRISGALIKVKSALIILEKTATASSGGNGGGTTNP